MNDYSYRLSRPLSYSNTICDTYQNNYKYSSNYNYNQRYSNDFFKPKRKKKWYSGLFKKKKKKYFFQIKKIKMMIMPKQQ